MSDILWDNNDPIRDLGIDVPRWISQDISPADVAAIVQGGCASGAYMPAVTYHEALATMGEYGDEILTYIEDGYGGYPQYPTEPSWAGLACHFVSFAVELWASSVEKEVRERLAERDEA